jgi:hypothetical protein
MGDADGILTLTSTYAPGTPILLSEFISFQFLENPIGVVFEVDAGRPGASISGVIPIDGGPATVEISDTIDGLFNSFANGGTFTLEAIQAQDSGPGVWISTVPEPATFGLLGLALAGVTLLARRPAPVASNSKAEPGDRLCRG